MNRMSPKKKDSSAFEAKLKRLEGIVESLGGSSISLEKALELYEEGLVLSKELTVQLKEAELRLKKIEKGVKGDISISDDESGEE